MREPYPRNRDHFLMKRPTKLKTQTILFFPRARKYHDHSIRHSKRRKKCHKECKYAKHRIKIKWKTKHTNRERSKGNEKKNERHSLTATRNSWSLFPLAVATLCEWQRQFQFFLTSPNYKGKKLNAYIRTNERTYIRTYSRKCFSPKELTFFHLTLSFPFSSWMACNSKEKFFLFFFLFKINVSFSLISSHPFKINSFSLTYTHTDTHACTKYRLRNWN